MNNVIAYADRIKSKIILSPAVKSMSVVSERILPDRGYFRARLILTNNDFLEVSEYFFVESERCVTKEYRYQWMNMDQTQLVRRWDNAAHFPELPNFPHHIHIGSESNVESGHLVGIIDLIDWFELKFSGT